MLTAPKTIVPRPTFRRVYITPNYAKNTFHVLTLLRVTDYIVKYTNNK